MLNPPQYNVRDPLQPQQQQQAAVPGAPLQPNALLATAETLKGSPAWFVLVILSQLLSMTLIVIGLALLNHLSSLLRVGLAATYFLLLITTCFFSMFTRDHSRERRIPALRVSIVNLKLRLVASSVFFLVAMMIFILIITIPSDYQEAFEQLGLTSLGCLLVLSTFLLTKTIQDRKEAQYFGSL